MGFISRDNLLSILRRGIQSIRRQGLAYTLRRLSIYVRFNLCFKYYKKYHQYKSSLRHEHPPDPFSIRYVAPNTITRMSPFRQESYQNDFGAIIDGNWDEDTKNINHYPLYNFIIKRIKIGVPWHMIDFYDEVLEDISNNRRRLGCSSKEQLDDRLEQIDQLITNIEEDGYKLSTETDWFNSNKKKNHLHCRELDEVIIDVTREGEPLLVDGRHRLAISTALGIETIPVLVARRHQEWQEYRERVARDDLFDDHFDLVDVVD